MRPRLLLHVCCGPCAIMPTQRLLDAGYEVTAWYHNPNIHPLSEYLRRREGVEQYADRLGLPVIFDDAAWNIREWLQMQQNNDTPPQRCHRCCERRIDAAYAFARAHQYDAFSSSLLYSRYQPHEQIAARGFFLSGQSVPAIAQEPAPPAAPPCFVYQDFRQDWQQGIDLSKEWGIYRQPYCGCIYSEAERYAKKLARLIVQ